MPRGAHAARAEVARGLDERRVERLEPRADDDEAERRRHRAVGEQHGADALADPERLEGGAPRHAEHHVGQHDRERPRGEQRDHERPAGAAKAEGR